MREPNLTANGLRIFVCSAFHDMQPERDALVARTFPHLRMAAERAGQGLQEVDLRWGITAEEAERGEVIEVCLDEIDACRPFFIAILGQRYGWVDPSVKHCLARRYPHLLPYAGRSVTELEVRHAILNSPPHQRRAINLVYLRATGDGPTAFPVADLEAVNALVREIEGHGIRVRRYSSALQLADLVLQDLSPLIEAALADARADRAGVDVEQVAFRTLHAASGFQGMKVLRRVQRALWFHRRLVIDGAPGSGKSALLVALTARLRRRRKPALASLSAAAGRWPRAISSLAHEIGQAETLVGRTFEELNQIIARHQGAIMIDSPETATSSVFGDGRDWIPHRWPAGTLIVATRSSDLAASLAMKGFYRLSITDFDRGERRALIRAVFAAHGKSLSAAQENRIVGHASAGQPAFLRVLAEELRHLGLFEQLDGHIDRLLAAPNTVHLFDMVLQRLEELEGVPAGVPRRALSMLLAARVGLSERDLLAVLDGSALGKGRPPVAGAGASGRMIWWSPIGLALRPFLLDRGGVLSIESQALREAVVARYATSDGQLDAERNELVDYFLSKRNEPRAIDELMFLLPATRRWVDAITLVCDAGWLAAARARDADALEAFFVAVLERTPDEGGTILARLTAVAASGTGTEATLAAVELLSAAGHPLRAAAAASAAADLYAGKAPDLYRKLIELRADALARAGRLDEALADLSALKAKGLDAAAGARLNERVASLALDYGQHDIAERLLADARAELERRKDTTGLLRLDGQRASIALARGDARRAGTLFAEIARSARRSENFDMLALALGGEATARRLIGDQRQALVLHREEERLWRVRGNRPALARSLVNQALCLIDRDDLDGADALFESAFMEAHGSNDLRLAGQIRHRQIDLMDRLGLSAGARAQELRRQADALLARGSQ